MLQFTPHQIAQLRERLQRQPQILTALHEQTDPVAEHFHIQKTALATWTAYYACPRHSVPLTMDMADSEHHVCPVDGEVFTGEPYVGAWWRYINSHNGGACHSAALIWLLTGEDESLELARRILVEYATYYPGYEIHGGIPYNKPGKANAQALCDAGWIKDLLAAYDILREALTVEERTLIERDLLRCAADFLMTVRTDQLHNHEVVVDSAIAMIGLLLEEPRYLSFGLEERYGLRYQLEHATLSDGLWFEGTPGYHFYAMDQFLAYEGFAWNTEHSFFHDPHFIEVLKFPLRLLGPDCTLPLLNDSGSGYKGLAGNERIYEQAYALSGDADMLRLLHLCYQGRERNNRYSFFHGPEELPLCEELSHEDYHGGAPGASGLTTLHGPDGRFLLVKHSPFGGEHDHYDRLGLSFSAFGTAALPDIGTCFYGAPLHYAHYKNTLPHNTVNLNGENQPPANGRVLRYERREDHVLLDTEARWDGSYKPLDSFTICQWSDEAYAGAVFRRIIAWYGEFFIDLFHVTVPESRSIDWVFHVRGLPQFSGPALHDRPWTETGPGSYLRDVQTLDSSALSWGFEGGVLEVYPLLTSGSTLYRATGPDNPSTKELSYLIRRVEGTEALFASVIHARREDEPTISLVSCERTTTGVFLEVRLKSREPVQLTYEF